MTLTKEQMQDLAYENSKLRHKLQYLWKHKKTGNLYHVENVVINEADLSPMVTYFPKEEPFIVFVRPYSEFIDRFERA